MKLSKILMTSSLILSSLFAAATADQQNDQQNYRDEDDGCGDQLWL